MPTYKVFVKRVGFGIREIVVSAKDEEAARRKALDVAGSYMYTEHDAEYCVDACQQLKEEDPT